MRTRGNLLRQQSESLVKASCVVVGIIAKNPKLFRKVDLFKKVLNLLLT